MKKLSLILLTTVLLLTGCSDSKKDTSVDKQKVMKIAKTIFGTLPSKMPGSENDTPELIELGKTLYFDGRLSENDKISCNSCHALDNKGAGVDNLPKSPGTKGENGVRNSPTVLNAGFQFVQFWDGRSPDLKDQAKGPILNPVEMAMPSEEAVVKKIGAIPEYQESFAKAFTGIDKPITFDNIAEAIAAFERTLITKDRFDMFLKGNVKAMKDDEVAGLELFIQKTCTTCHAGALLGGNLYQKTGLLKPYKNLEDEGRFEVTGNEIDKFMFKVPTLRNVALTAPYMHDGGIATLDEAVRVMADIQLNQKLNEDEVKKIVAFLNTLSDIKLTRK